MDKDSRFYKAFQYLVNDNFVDRMKELGPGISSFHRMILYFIGLLLMLFLMHIPVLWNYSEYNFYEQSKVGFIVKRSIGNMGFSQTECDSTMLHNSHQQDLKCKSG